MKVFTIIFGVLMMLCGISLMCTPFRTFLQTGYWLLILMAVYGIVGIITAIANKKYGANFIFAIISILASVVLCAIPGSIIFIDAMSVYCMAVWFILQGVLGIANSLKAKKSGKGSWGWILAFGIIGVIVGIYSVFHPVLSAFTIGILIGVYFLESGFNMLFLSSVSEEL